MYRSHEHAVHTAGGFLYGGDRVFVEGIDHELSTVLAREVKLVVGDVDGRDAQSHRLGILHGDMA